MKKKRKHAVRCKFTSRWKKRTVRQGNITSRMSTRKPIILDRGSTCHRLHSPPQLSYPLKNNPPQPPTAYSACSHGGSPSQEASRAGHSIPTAVRWLRWLGRRGRGRSRRRDPVLWKRQMPRSDRNLLARAVLDPVEALCVAANPSHSSPLSTSSGTPLLLLQQGRSRGQ